MQEWIHVVCRKTVRTLLCSDPAVHDQGTIQSNIEILCKYIGVQCFPYCCKMRQIPARCPYNADAIPLCAQKHSFAWLTHLRLHRYAAFKKIPLDALKKLPSPMNLICVTPTRIDALFSNFKKDGYSVRQVLHQLA